MTAAQEPLWVRDPRTGSEGYILMPLEAGSAGTYNGTLEFSNTESLEDVCIIDGAGVLVWQSPKTSIDDESNVQYQIQDDTQDLFVAAKASKSLSVSASFTAHSVSPASSSSVSASRERMGPNLYLSGLLSGIAFGIIWV
jgi:hypothetical protein